MKIKFLATAISLMALLLAGFTANAIVYRGISVFDSKPAKGDGIVRLVTTTA